MLSILHIDKVQESCKNARRDCSILDSVLTHMANTPPQQLERPSQKSLWSLLKRKALEFEIQDVQVVCHPYNVQTKHSSAVLSSPGNKGMPNAGG